MSKKGVIFDMDGLLFDTEKIYQETWHELALEYQVTLPDDFVQQISGTSGAHMCRVLERYYQVEEGSILQKCCLERVRQKLMQHVPLKKGAEEILQFFQEKGYPIAVASSSSKEQIKANLEKAGLDRYFDKVVSGMEVPNGKPAPDVFLLAASQLSIEPEHCYVFEDSANGVKAGYAAGCMTIMIPDLIKPTEEVIPLCSGIYPDLLEAMQAMKKEV